MGSYAGSQTNFKSLSHFKNVSLVGAKIVRDINLGGAIFDGDLIADGVQIGGELQMSTPQDKASFKAVSLTSARVGDDIIMNGASFGDSLSATSLQAGGDLYMRNASFGEVNLNGTRVVGTLDMQGASFDGNVDADSLQVGTSLFMTDSVFAKTITMTFSRIGGNLDLRGATIGGLDLSGTSVNGDFRLGGSNAPAVWRSKDDKPGDLILRNTHVSDLMDAADAWPDKGHLHLDGFAFTHVGSFEGDVGPEAREGGMEWWDRWARRDTAYSPMPYEQLAFAMTAAGNRTASDELRYLGRVRQRETEKNWGPWIFSGFLRYAAGFGIGDYTWRVLYWVIAISGAGAFYLWRYVPNARANGPAWCLFASASRLLPAIEINKEFTDFFNDPGRTNLTRRETLAFSIIGMVGFVLGAILIAAVSGLTQKP
jgi:hypothetical protein